MLRASGKAQRKAGHCVARACARCLHTSLSTCLRIASVILGSGFQARSMSPNLSVYGGSGGTRPSALPRPWLERLKSEEGGGTEPALSLGVELMRVREKREGIVLVRVRRVWVRVRVCVCVCVAGANDSDSADDKVQTGAEVEVGGEGEDRCGASVQRRRVRWYVQVGTGRVKAS
jgi:hypothetical protein